MFIYKDLLKDMLTSGTVISTNDSCSLNKFLISRSIWNHKSKHVRCKSTWTMHYCINI